MKATLVGFEHLQGVSKKTGNDYNFYKCYFTAADKRVTGYKVLETLVNPDNCPDLEKLQLPARCDLIKDFDNRVRLSV